ncbi:MAG TPA: beta-galactosidase [Chitinophagaceae bacterium]
MKRLSLLISFFWLIVLAATAQSTKHSFEIKDGNFLYDGKPIQIHSGEMHFARVPHQYWRHRFRMMKAMGLNTVATYVFWNFHEPLEGQWNFKGDHDLASFIKTAGEEGLMVILRPGPYACAEWDFGGYPWWLQNVKELQSAEGLLIRRDNPIFLSYTKKYIDRLAKEVKHLQITNGGPLIMVQAENEFGSYVAQRPDISMEAHHAYNAAIKKQLVDAGFNVPLFTSDGNFSSNGRSLFEGGYTAGALPTGNGEDNIKKLKDSVNKYNGGKGPYMVAEFYPGWLMHWAEPFPKINPGRVARQTEAYLKNDVSFNFYMVHGGTNFGFTAGANYDKNHDLQPDITSYDYGAPISEAGWRTASFDSIRGVMQRYSKEKLPAPPAPLPVIAIPSIKLTKAVNLFELTEKLAPVIADTPVSFENLKQAHGYVLYSRKFTQPVSGTLKVTGLRDYATVYVNGEKVGELNRYYKKYELPIDIPFNATLQILVENMGRINYGTQIIHNQKGIISAVYIGDQPITGGWEMQGLPFENEPGLSALKGVKLLVNSKVTAAKNKAAIAGAPVVYEGSFQLTATGDTFLDIETWGKGIVFINGINIGRYWSVGPQQTLYIPGVYLKKGMNRISIFEQQNAAWQTEVRTIKEPVLTKLKQVER